MKRTKKFIATLFTMLLACLCMLFSGCQFSLLPPKNPEDTVAGVYKTKSVTFTQGETTQEVHVGETVDGVTLTEDYMKIILTEDGYFVMESTDDGERFATKGNWTKSEEEKFLLSVHDQTITLDYTGSTITFQPTDYHKIILEKKAVTPSATQAQAMGCYQLKSITSSSGEAIDISADYYGRYDLSFILTEDGCGYIFASYNGFPCDLAQAENGKLSINVSNSAISLIGECDGTKITATLDGKTYVFEK